MVSLAGLHNGFTSRLLSVTTQLITNHPLLATACLAAATGIPLFLSTFIRNFLFPPKSPFSATSYPDLTSGEFTIPSEDGKRTISWAEYGTASDNVLIYFHGIPGSRIIMLENLRQLCMGNGIRIIAPDRPGIGQTSPKPRGTKTADITSENLAEILKHRGIKQVTLVGYSLGAVEALHFQLLHSSMVKKTYLLGPAGFDTHADKLTERNLNAHWYAVYAPWVLNFFWIRNARRMVSNPNFINVLIAQSPQQDQSLLSEEDRRLWRVSTAETFAQGITGLRLGLLEGFGKKAPNGWGFDMTKIPDPKKVTIYHGNLDKLSHLESARELAGLIGCELIEIEDVGHFGIIRCGLERVFEKCRTV